MTVAERLAEIDKAIRERAEGRAVTLVAVTKYASLDQMREAYAAGIRDFGENKVQDALEKMEAFPPANYPDLRWHFIGNLQTNKARKTVGRFAMIHAVDGIRQAEAISRANQQAGLCQPVLMQINYSGDPDRHGFTPDQALSAARSMQGMPGIDLRGLMTMAPAQASLDQDEAMLSTVFCGLRGLRDELAQTLGIDLPELSMGMTHDFPHALACGATILRIGNYLFQK